MSNLFEQLETDKPTTKAILSWTLMRFVVAAIMLTAAFMKAYQLATTPSLGEGLLHARWFNILVVEFELFFGIWLIFGMLPKLTWLTSIGCFTVFAVVSLYKAISGEASCGCFGSATINPWITTVFNLIMIVALTVVRTKDTRFQRIDLVWGFPKGIRKKRIIAIALAWSLLAIPAAYAMISVKSSNVAELGTEFIGANGRRTVMLEPKKWIGKECPLFSRFVQSPDVEKLKQNDCTAILIHTNCSKCMYLLSDLENRQSVDNVAIIVVPSHMNDNFTSPNFPSYRLDSKNDWFVTTPCILKLADGICTETFEDFKGT